MLDGSSGYYVGNDVTNHQKQVNIVDSVDWSRGSHGLKFGLDYRRLSPTNGYRPWEIDYLANSFEELAQGKIFEARVISNDAAVLRPVFTNVSLYAQDAWRVKPRLTLTYGVRWDYDPPPSESSGHPLFTAINLNDPALCVAKTLMAFLNQGFARRATGRTNNVVAGVTTIGLCSI
jgi:outer membrane receptor protein involved in Fe transport